jgi:hypothetical protein
VDLVGSAEQNFLLPNMGGVKTALAVVQIQRFAEIANTMRPR